MRKHRKWLACSAMATGLIALLVLVQSMQLYAQEGIPLKGAGVSTEEKTGEIVTVTGIKTNGLMDLELEDTDIKDVLRALSRVSGMNIVVGEDVEARVTISMKKVGWEKALDVILRTYNFTSVREDNFIRVMTFDRLKNEETNIPLVTRVIYLNFVDVGDMKGSLGSMLTKRGSMATDKRTNSLIITDISTVVDKLAQVAAELDTRTPQVMIEAMMVDVVLTDEDSLGINWSIIGEESGGADFLEQLLGLSGSESARFAFAKTMGVFDVTGLVEAWQREQKAEILANPKVMTLDNLSATIELIEEEPYESTTETQDGSVTSTAFKETGVKLKVTPHITKDGFISMNVKPEQSFKSGTTSDNQPIIDTRRAETNVIVRSGETIIIGGLRRVKNTTTLDKVPILSDIPLLGLFFRRMVDSKETTELLIFVTPYIVEDGQLTPEEMEKYKSLDGEAEEKAREEERARLQVELQAKLEAQREEQTGLQAQKKTLEEARKNKIEAYYQKGLRYFKEEKYRQARDEFAKVLELEPKQRNAEEYIKRSKNKMKEVKLQAEREKEELKKKEWKMLQVERERERQRQVAVYYSQGKIDYYLKRYREAIDEFKEVLSLDPEHKTAGKYIERSLKNLEKEKLRIKKEEARFRQKQQRQEKLKKDAVERAELQIFEQVRKETKEKTRKQERAKLEAQREEQAALQAQKKTLEEARKNKIEAYYQKGLRYFKEEKYRQARDEFAKVLELEPKQRNAEKYIKRSLKNLEKEKLRIKKEEARFRQKQEQQKESKKGAVERADFQAAEQARKEAEEKSRKQERAKLEAQREEQAALQAQKKTLEEARKNKIEAYYQKGLRYFKEEKYRQARDEFAKVLELEPGQRNAEKYIKRSEERIKKKAIGKKKEEKKAKNKEEQAGLQVQKKPREEARKKKIEAHYQKGLRYFREEKYQQAKDEFRKMIELTYENE